VGVWKEAKHLHANRFCHEKGPENKQGGGEDSHYQHITLRFLGHQSLEVGDRRRSFPSNPNCGKHCMSQLTIVSEKADLDFVRSALHPKEVDQHVGRISIDCGCGKSEFALEVGVRLSHRL